MEHDDHLIRFETVAWADDEQSRREEQAARDLAILNSRADYLNAEVADVLSYQVLPEDELFQHCSTPTRYT